MSLTDNGGLSAADVAAVMGSNGNNNGFGGFGGDGAWWLLLFLFALGGNGFGNGFGGNSGMMNGMMWGFDGLYPWMNQSNQIAGGFRDQMLNDNITSIRDGVQGLSTQLCNCCGDMQMALANGFSGVEQGANARQIANMNQAFNAQTAMLQGFNNIQSQFADCCCENRLANCQTQNIIQNEGNATRFADANNTRDLLSAITAGIQSIKDDLCQDRLDAERRENQNLRSELMYARGQASQIEQTAQLLANNNAQTALFQQGLNDEVDALYNRLNNCPVGTVPVYGRTPIFNCNNNNGCGCGCNG